MGNEKNTSASFTPKERRKGTPKVFKNIGWYFAVLIVVLLIVIMAVPSFGIFSRNATGEEYVFGKFGNNDIKFASGSYMQNAYVNTLQQYSQYFNQEQISSMQMQIMQQAFQSAATFTAFDYYASKYKMNITEEEIDDYLRENYTNDKGEFDTTRWKNLSATERTRIRDNVKTNIIGDRLRGLYTNSPISDAEVEALRVYKQAEKEKNFQEQQEKDSREGIETEENKAELVDVTSDEVITSIRNSASDRFYDSVLKSDLLVDNFTETYTTKILPLLTSNEESTPSETETTVEDEASDTVVADDTAEVTVADTATTDVGENTINTDAVATTRDNRSDNATVEVAPSVSEVASETPNVAIETTTTPVVSTETPSGNTEVSATIEPIETAPSVQPSTVQNETPTTIVNNADNNYDTMDFVLRNGEGGVSGITNGENVDLTLRNSEGGVKGIDNTVDFTLE